MTNATTAAQAECLARLVGHLRGLADAIEECCNILDLPAAEPPSEMPPVSPSTWFATRRFGYPGYDRRRRHAMAVIRNLNSRDSDSWESLRALTLSDVYSWRNFGKVSYEYMRAELGTLGIQLSPWILY